MDDVTMTVLALGNEQALVDINRTPSPLQRYPGGPTFYFACTACGACGKHSESLEVAAMEGTLHLVRSHMEDAYAPRPA